MTGLVNPVLVLVYFFSSGSWMGLAQQGRPSFAGASGGTWESYVGQRIPPGTPWPAKAEDYTTTTDTTLSSKTPVDQTPSTIKNTVTGAPFSNTTNASISTSDPTKPTTTSSTTLVLGNAPDRPSFAGASSGSWENLVGQRIPPGTPWPAKAEDYTTTTDTTLSSKTPVAQTPSGMKITVTDASINTSPSTTPNTVTVLENRPVRPSFAGGSSGTEEMLVGQKIPPGTPWPNKASDSNNSSSGMTTNPHVDGQMSSTASSIPSTTLQKRPDRPSFAGSPGFNWNSPANQPVPSKETEDNVSSIVPEQSGTVIRNNATSKPRPQGETASAEAVPTDAEDDTTSTASDFKPSIVLEYIPNRPSFAGNTSGSWENLVGQVVVPNQENQLGTNSDSGSDSGPSLLEKLPFVYIALDREDIKAAIKSSITPGSSNVRLLALDLNLKNLRQGNDPDRDISEISEQFRVSEKCKTEKKSSASRHVPVLSLLVNVEGLRDAVREYYVETKKEDTQL